MIASSSLILGPSSIPMGWVSNLLGKTIPVVVNAGERPKHGNPRGVLGEAVRDEVLGMLSPVIGVTSGELSKYSGRKWAQVYHALGRLEGEGLAYWTGPKYAKQWKRTK